MLISISSSFVTRGWEFSRLYRQVGVRVLQFPLLPRPRSFPRYRANRFAWSFINRLLLRQPTDRNDTDNREYIAADGSESCRDEKVYRPQPL